MHKSLYLALAFALSACSVKPITPLEQELTAQFQISERWLMASAEQAEKNQAAWWYNFNNSELNGLIAQAMQHNQDLRAAAYTWQKARLAIDNAALNQSITASGSLGANASRNYGNNQNNHHFSAALSASYQIDLWQKLAATSQVAQWQSDASAEDLLAARLSLQGEVANAWLALLYAQAKLKLNQAQSDYQQQSYRLVQTRFQAGSASELEVSQAKQALSALAISQRSLQAEIEQTQIALSILLGQPPQAVIVKTTLSELTIPSIGADLPAALLHQRPDLRAAQYRLQADLGNIAVAERDFYPSINLNASLNSGSSILGDLLQNPIVTIANSISLPFLQNREKNLALNSSETQYQANLASFHQKLYRAFADVEKALSALKESQDNAALIAARLKEAEKIERLSQIRYQAGADSLQSWLDAQQSRRDKQAAQLDNHYQQLTRSIALYLALGGSSDSAFIAP